VVKIKITTTPFTCLGKKINMHHKDEGCWHQMEISSLDCNIDTENVVRFIDAFVCKLDFVKLKFEKGTLA
jgi:hypothetical protein